MYRLYKNQIKRSYRVIQFGCRSVNILNSYHTETDFASFRLEKKNSNKKPWYPSYLRLYNMTEWFMKILLVFSGLWQCHIGDPTSEEIGINQQSWRKSHPSLPSCIDTCKSYPFSTLLLLFTSNVVCITSTYLPGLPGFILFASVRQGLSEPGFNSDLVYKLK